jgi:gamma-butyrobetaine dioxygenase
VTAVETIGALFAGPGARDYLGEPVTIGEHMRQAGRLAEAGARWLSQWFGEAVTEPVRLHAPAKRYLCAVEAGYLGLLSAESLRTLALQGGPMTAAEAAAFEARPHARDAVAVRR